MAMSPAARVTSSSRDRKADRSDWARGIGSAVGEASRARKPLRQANCQQFDQSGYRPLHLRRTFQAGKQWFIAHLPSLLATSAAPARQDALMRTKHPRAEEGAMFEAGQARKAETVLVQRDWRADGGDRRVRVTSSDIHIARRFGGVN